jgi:nucleoside-diphosphate-sugar epimerase
MANALIGHTGFVGGNLTEQTPFEHLYNSKTIDEIAGREFDTLVCCGAPAEKWKANADPEADRANIRRLLSCVERAQARRVVLVSTVDVYAAPVGVDEDSPVGIERQSPYGRHRYELELAIQARFDSLVVRLPGLFGKGLKKNAIYDLLHDHRVEHIHRAGVYQFYDVGVLWRDIERALAHDLKVVNIATEPVSMSDVAAAAFGRDLSETLHGEPARYDMRSRFDRFFSGSGGYLYDRHWVLTRIARYVEEERGRIR